MTHPQSSLTIRDPQDADESAWRGLWQGYVEFYEAEVPEEVTAATWRRIVTPGSSLFGRLAAKNGEVVGFTVSVLHAGSWTIAPICYLEDLFVDPKCRGAGAGRALIDDLVTRGRALGWSKIYWHTRASNAAARRLYNTFASADDFVRYRLFLDRRG